MTFFCKSSEYHKEPRSTKWLKAYYSDTTGSSIDLYSPKLKPVHDFMLIWNIFERDVLNHYNEEPKRFSAHSIFDYAERYIPDSDAVCSFYNYIKNRYTNPENGLIRFERLLLSSFEDKVKPFLSGNPSLIEKNQVCLMVAWRYRNNLFHGNKEPAMIIKQTELFIHANDYLISFIEWMTKKGKVLINDNLAHVKH